MAQTLTATDYGDNATEQRPLDHFELSEMSGPITKTEICRIHTKLTKAVDQRQWLQVKSSIRELIRLSEKETTSTGEISTFQQILLLDHSENENDVCTPLIVSFCKQSAPLDVVRMVVNYSGTKDYQEALLFQTDRKSGRTALHEAVAHGASVAVLKCLLDAAQNVLANQLEALMEKQQKKAAEEKGSEGPDSEPPVRPFSSVAGEKPSFLFPSLLELNSEENSPLHDALKHNCGLEMIDMLIQYDEKLQQYNRRSTIPAVLQTNAEHAVPLYLACEQAVGKAGATSLSSAPVLKHLILCTYRSHMLRKQAGRVSPFSLALSTSKSTLLRAALETNIYMGQYAHKVLRLVVEHVPDQLWQWYKHEDGRKKMLLDWVNVVMNEPVSSPIDAMRKMSIQDKSYRALKTVGDNSELKEDSANKQVEDRPKKRK